MRRFCYFLVPTGFNYTSFISEYVDLQPSNH